MRAGGLCVGAGFGAACELTAAPFTFGLSIVVGAVCGGSVGLATGTTVGGTIGLVRNWPPGPQEGPGGRIACCDQQLSRPLI